MRAEAGAEVTAVICPWRGCEKGRSQLRMVPESQNGCVDITLQVMELQKGFQTRRTGLTGVLER